MKREYEDPLEDSPNRQRLIWLRVTIALDVVVRLVVLAGLIYILVVLWPGEGLSSFVFLPTLVYATWHVLVVSFEIVLLRERRPSRGWAQESIGAVALVGSFRLVWVVGMMLNENQTAWELVAIGAATGAVLVSAIAYLIAERLTSVRSRRAVYGD